MRTVRIGSRHQNFKTFALIPFKIFSNQISALFLLIIKYFEGLLGGLMKKIFIPICFSVVLFNGCFFPDEEDCTEGDTVCHEGYTNTCINHEWVEIGREHVLYCLY